MIKFYIRLILIILLSLIITSAFPDAQDIYPFSTTKQSQQFQTITEQLRCLVCQNESLADSNAGLAQDLRKQIYTMVLAGNSNQQIKSYMVARYGNFILFKPSINTSTYVLWFLPFLLLVLIIVVAIIFIRKHKIAVELTAEDKKKLSQLLNDKE